MVVAWHGYARSFHQLLHGRPNPERFHVRGYSQQGSTTTPFDMVVVNRMSRYHLALEALRRMARQLPGAEALAELATGSWTPTPATSASTSRTCPKSVSGSGRRRARPALTVRPVR